MIQHTEGGESPTRLRKMKEELSFTDALKWTINFSSGPCDDKYMSSKVLNSNVP